MRQSTTALILIVAGVIACLLGKGRPSTGQPNSVMRPSFHEQKESTPLLQILEGTSPERGEDFFTALVKSLFQSPDRAAAWVTEHAAEKMSFL
jgi:hypothetical protein